MTQLNYTATGNADGPALLLVHGFLSSNAQWIANIEAADDFNRAVLSFFNQITPAAPSAVKQ